MKLIVGLGNPGREYENTRHNVGFQLLDVIAEDKGLSFNRDKFNAKYCEYTVRGEKVILIKPLSYMNLSGGVVSRFVSFYKIKASDILVIQDDLDMSVGRIKIVNNSSSGGHNGIKSIIAHAGTQNFMRIKVGVGEKPSGWDLADYVLGHFSEEDKQKLKETMPDIMQAAALIVQGDVDKAMNDFNAKKQVSE